MRIAVYPHVLEIGGSQLNAVELAAGVRDLGHDVLVVGRPGPLLGRVVELGLEFVALPEPVRRPSRAVTRALARLVRERGIEVLHGYEWTAGLECYLAARATGAASICTVMSMAVPPFLPTDQGLVVGTRQIAAHCEASGRAGVRVIEPPVDLVHNRMPDEQELGRFRSEHDLEPGRMTVVAVSRFASALKLEGLLTAMDTVAALDAGMPIQLVLAGSGPEAATVRDRATAVNDALGRRAVVLTGELADPRPAYAVADVVLGMGGSALRAMAFSRPLVVQGEHGFWRTLTPQSLPDFLWAGWYGVGEGVASGATRLTSELLPLFDDARLRTELGRFAREVVEQQFSLDHASAVQSDIYRDLMNVPARAGVTMPALRAAGRFARYKAARKVQRWRGKAAVDDFNARPVVLAHGPAVTAAATTASS